MKVKTNWELDVHVRDSIAIASAGQSLDDFFLSIPKIKEIYDKVTSIKDPPDGDFGLRGL